MQYRYIIILLSLSLLTGCFKYKNFEDVSNDLSQPPHVLNNNGYESYLQTITSLHSGENTAYWSQKDQQILIYPHLWQSNSTSGHTIQLEEKQAIRHAIFNTAYLDYAYFDENDENPQVLIRSQIDNQYHLEIYQMQAYHPTLIFRLSTMGNIDYAINEVDKKLSNIVSENIIDNTIQTNHYQYDSTNKQFKLVHSENISLESAESEYRELEEFLAGPWRSNSPQSEGGMVIFIPKEKQILFEQDRIEIYEWLSSSRTGNRISVRARNLQIQHISGNTTLTIIDANTIELQSVVGNARQGRYYRINLQEDQINNHGPKSIIVQKIPFQGTYLNQSNEELIFNYPLFSKKDTQGYVRNGSMALFEINDTLVMQLRYRSSHGLVEEQENYEIFFKEENNSLHHTRLLQLKPTRLFIFGSYPLPNSVVEHFEQIERIK